MVRAQPPRREVIATTLTGADVRRIAGNQNDPIKAVQNLPGVARAPFGIGQIIVWGSAPTDTRAYADGVAIPASITSAACARRSALSSCPS